MKISIEAINVCLNEEISCEDKIEHLQNLGYDLEDIIDIAYATTDL